MDFVQLATKWQKKWEDAKLFEAEPDDRDKFYLTAAFPYPNSPQHIGHARTYTITDVYARFMRMTGKNVLFPMAFHVTGTPIMAMARRVEEKDPELMDIFTKIYGMDKEYAQSLTNPRDLVMAFSKEIEIGMREMGFSIDWRRKFYTFDSEFNSFVTWQFHKLKEAGLITKGKHPVPYCPKCGNAVGGHDTKGDVEPELGEFILLKFKFEDGYLPAATLRPETVYGVTNMWVNAKGDYVKARVDGEVYYISKVAFEKFRLQDHKVELLGEVRGDYFVGKTCVAPLTGKEVMVYNSSFVDVSNATGVVMSVPAHAPYDYVALKEAVGGKADGMLISVISVDDKELGKFPAKSIADAMGIASVDDPKLEEATKVVYRRELHNGVMNVEELRGMKVEQARDKVKEMLIASKEGGILHEIMNRPVRCRCGGVVEVKIFEDQWFIDYGNAEWKEKARGCLKRMAIVPANRRKDFEYSIDWLHEKACTRATGLGTRFPFDENKMIEALSDSTIYMAFYTVKHLLNRPLSVEEWDYVMLGRKNGNVEKERELQEMRRHFEYWYPLDSRHSGADLIYNHLPFFIFNHSGIFPEKKWPRQIVVNGFVLMDGAKMSKSLGNILPLRKAIAEYGPDPIRISVVGGAELGEDTDFNSKMVEGIVSRLRFMAEMCGNMSERAEGDAERWLEMRFATYYDAALANYESLNLRGVVNDLLYKFVNDVKWCVKRGGRPSKRAVQGWVKLMSPMCPHYCDELWERMGNGGFASMQRIDAEGIAVEPDPALEEGERIIEQTVNDIAEIKKILGKEPEKITLIVADTFKRDVFNAIGDSRNMNDAIKRVMANSDIKARGKEALNIVKSAMHWKSAVVLSEQKEWEIMKDGARFIERECGAPVEVIMEKNAKEEMAEKARRALPGKPSIVLS